MEVVVTLIALVCIAFIFYKIRTNKVYFAGGQVPLESDMDYEFLWFTSFENKVSADAIVAELEEQHNLLGKIKQSPNGKSWMVTLSCIMKPNSKLLAKYESAIHKCCDLKGGVYLHSAVSNPNAPEVTFD